MPFEGENTCLLKVDEDGVVQWEHLSESYVNPVSGLFSALEVGGGSADVFTFVGMGKQQLGTHIVEVNTAGEEDPELASVAYFGSFSYPLAANVVGGGFAILHWNRDNKSGMQLSRIKDAAALRISIGQNGVENFMIGAVFRHFYVSKSSLFPSQRQKHFPV